jgi:hypothetical protein
MASSNSNKNNEGVKVEERPRDSWIEVKIKRQMPIEWDLEWEWVLGVG